MTKLALLSCRSPFLDDSKIYAPMANLYLKSYVNKFMPGVEVVLGDDNYELDNPDFWRPFDYVGVSIMTPQREQASEILRAVKKFSPRTKVIAGGPHVKHYLEDVVKQEWDYVVPLDGERALLKILHGDNRRVIHDVMDKRDILEQPRPDRQSENAVEVIKRYHYVLGGREATTMMTARGCPEQCTFCEDALTAVKWSSLDNIKGELDDIKNLGYRGVYIFDDLFAIAMPMVKPIVQELRKRDLIFRCNGQVRYFTKWGEEFAKILGESGCYEIAFGFESGSQKILDNVRKRTTVEQNYLSVQYAKKHGIKVKGFVMLGLPGETLETIAETEAFIRSCGMDDFQLAVYYPYKGTQIRDAIDRGEGAVDLAFMGEGLGAYGQRGGSSEAVVRTQALSAEELLAHRDRIVREYKPKSHGPKWEDKFFEGGKNG